MTLLSKIYFAKKKERINKIKKDSIYFISLLFHGNHHVYTSSLSRPPSIPESLWQKKKKKLYKLQIGLGYRKTIVFDYIPRPFLLLIPEIVYNFHGKLTKRRLYMQLEDNKSKEEGKKTTEFILTMY